MSFFQGFFETAATFSGFCREDTGVTQLVRSSVMTRKLQQLGHQLQQLQVFGWDVGKVSTY